MKRMVTQFALILISGTILFSLPGCDLQSSQVSEDEIKSGIIYYDAFFEIEPMEGVFRSQQRVTMAADQAKGNTLTFYLANSLVIDYLAMEDDQGNEFPLRGWKKNGGNTSKYFLGKLTLSEIEVKAKSKLPTEGELVVILDYHLPAEMIQQVRTDNFYNLFVSTLGSHIGGPESGAFPMVSGDLEAPFRIAIRHPDAWRCVLPGEVTDYEESSGYVSITYEAAQAYDPSFACAPYQVMRTEVDEITFEIYAPETLDLSQQMLSDGAAILSLYTTQFGHPLASSLRIVFPDLENSSGGGESNGNLVILGDIMPYVTYDEAARDTFAELVGHEGYHLWNTWSLHWQGKLAEWWMEGGATFMASWVQETLDGSGSGANIRLRNLITFDEQQAYQHKHPLAKLDESWFDDWALVYVYGAQVWEQLRQAVGDEALKAGLKEFYTTFSGRSAGYYELVGCIQKHTPIDVEIVLKQWTEQNAKIDLSIKAPTIREMKGHYQVEVGVDVQADSDFLIFTSLGYRTSPQGEWQLVDLLLQKTGVQTVVFKSDTMPVMIQVDPEYRVPQVNLSDNAWVK